MNYEDMNGLMICPSMLFDPMPAEDKLILSLIDACDNGKGCRIPNRTLSKVVGLSIPSVRKRLCKMAETDEIKIEMAGFSDRILRIPNSPWTTYRAERRAARVAINKLLVDRFGSPSLHFLED